MIEHKNAPNVVLPFGTSFYSGYSRTRLYGDPGNHAHKDDMTKIHRTQAIAIVGEGDRGDDYGGDV